jgi:transposase
MTCDPEHLPDDPNELKRMIVALLEADVKKQATLDSLVAEVSRLNVTIQKLTEMLFGKKSEKLSKDQSNAEPETNETTPTTASDPSGSGETPKILASEPPRRKKKNNGGGGRMKIPKHLPVKIVENYPPLDERTCSECKIPFKTIGFETSRQVVYVPGHFEMLETHHMKCVADCPCSAKRSATGEPAVRPIDKGIASISLLAIITVMKYADHLPLARQSLRIFTRSGLVFAQSSMCRWMKRVAELLEPLYDLICAEVLLSHCMQIDATFVKCRDENLKGRCRQTYIYGARGDDSQPYDAFYFSRDGTSKSLMKFVEGFENTMQCDANSVHNPVFLPKNTESGKRAPREQGCWSHGRRNFVKAGPSNPDVVFVLEMIGELYEVERQAKGFTVDKRLALRQCESVEILNRIFAWCRENKDKYVPKESMRTAIEYLLNNEAALRLFCTDGRLEIDNNACERMLRQWAVGRKNWLFFGNAGGGKTASILVTILSSAHRHGLNEFEYLCDILARLSDLQSESAIRDLLPDRWKLATAEQ